MRFSGWSLRRQTKPDVIRLSQGIQARVEPGEQTLSHADGFRDREKSPGAVGSGSKLVLILRESEMVPSPSLCLLGTQ